MSSAGGPQRNCKAELTVRNHHSSNEERHGPAKEVEERSEGHDDVNKRRDDVEQKDFEDMVDGCTTIQDTKDLSSLALRVECQRKVQEMVEAELGHFYTWKGIVRPGPGRTLFITHLDRNIASLVPKEPEKLRQTVPWTG